MTEQSKEAVVEQAKQVREELLTVMETLGNNMCDVIERAEALREENESLLREVDENAALAMQHKMRVDDLAKENAELKARLEKAVELPFSPIDYHIEAWAAEIKPSLTDERVTIVIPVYVYLSGDNRKAAEDFLGRLDGLK